MKKRPKPITEKEYALIKAYSGQRPIPFTDGFKKVVILSLEVSSHYCNAQLCQDSDSADMAVKKMRKMLRIIKNENKTTQSKTIHCGAGYLKTGNESLEGFSEEIKTTKKTL